jgi:hypothetical protein
MLALEIAGAVVCLGALLAGIKKNHQYLILCLALAGIFLFTGFSIGGSVVMMLSSTQPVTTATTNSIIVVSGCFSMLLTMYVLRRPQEKPKRRAKRHPRRKIQHAFNILGIPVEAAPNKITRAYLEKVHIHHPRNGGNADNFKMLNWAFRVAQDSIARRK